MREGAGRTGRMSLDEIDRALIWATATGAPRFQPFIDRLLDERLEAAKAQRIRDIVESPALDTPPS